MKEDVPQRDHDLRELFNAMRWVVCTGTPWRYMTNDLPPEGPFTSGASANWRRACSRP